MKMSWSLIKLAIKLASEKINECKDKLMKERMNIWMNELIYKWPNTRINEYRMNKWINAWRRKN